MSFRTVTRSPISPPSISAQLRDQIDTENTPKDGVHGEVRARAAELGQPGGGATARVRVLQDGLQIHPQNHGGLQPWRRRFPLPPSLHRRRRDPKERSPH